LLGFPVLGHPIGHHGHPTRPQLLTPPGNPVQECQTVPTVSTIFRVVIHDTMEDIFVTTPVRWVKYQRTSIDSDDDDNQYNNYSTVNTWQGGPSITGETVFPYNIDISDVVDNSDQWVEVKFLLAKNKNIAFYSNTASNMNGVTTTETFSVDQMCYEVRGDNGNGRLVYKLYVHSKGTTAKLHRFSIALVANVGAKDTPVIIDPKILNLG
jgi:hypothetical protein